ncbi:MAG: hypothetical protein JNM26_02490, partial [Ideonella sp.]|nr:hypothetical protein [Ideonella sp.]
MTELGRTSALTALVGQILHPRGGSFVGSRMEMDKDGWMRIAPKRPTDYLGTDTGAAMDILKAVADERIAASAPPPAPAPAGPGMRCGGLVGRRRMAVGGLVSPLPAVQGTSAGAFSPQPVAAGALGSRPAGAIASPIAAASGSVVPASAVSGALEAPAPQQPPLATGTAPNTSGAFSGAFGRPAITTQIARVGGAATTGGGLPSPITGGTMGGALTSGYFAPGQTDIMTPTGPLAAPPGTQQAGALQPQRYLKSNRVAGAMKEGGLSMFKGPGLMLLEKGLAEGGLAAPGADEEEAKGGGDDVMKGLGQMLMQSGTQLMNKNMRANGGVVDAAMAATGAKMAAASGGPQLAPGDVYSPGEVGPAAPDELPLDGSGMEATTARLGILGSRYQASNGPGVAAGTARPTIQFVGGKAHGGLVHGPGDGRSDSIPVDLAGAPGAIADGEYVVPAYAVSALGNGSSAAGARKLDSMVGALKTNWPKKVRGFGKPKAGGKPMMADGGLTLHQRMARGGAFAEGGAKVPGYVQRSQKNIYSRLEKLQDERPYEQDVAKLTGDQLQAFQQARDVATNDSTGYFKAVQGGQDLLSGIFDGDGSNKAYDDELVQASLDDFDRGARIASADADRKAAGRGAFGSRRGITEAAAAEQNTKNRALLGSQLREQGLERRTAAANTIANLAGQERNAAIGNVALLTGVGNQIQEYNQSIKDAGMNRLSRQAAIVAGTPWSGGGAGNSKLKGALGGAMAGAGAGAMTGNPYAIA